MTDFPGHVSTALTDYAEDFANARTSDIEKWKKESGYLIRFFFRFEMFRIDSEIMIDETSYSSITSCFTS